MAQPVTPQDHILETARRITAQQAAAKALAADLAAERANALADNRVQPPAAAEAQ